jgi:hypothetical protein
MIADLRNDSAKTIRLESVSVSGRGIGSTVAVLGMKVAPLFRGTHSTPGGVYETYPPAIFVEHKCHVQKLLPVRGFQMAPNAEARLHVLMRSDTVGRFRVDHHIITYRIGWQLQKQVFPVGLIGSVAATAAPAPVDRGERRCSGLTTILPLGG